MLKEKECKNCGFEFQGIATEDFCKDTCEAEYESDMADQAEDFDRWPYEKPREEILEDALNGYDISGDFDGDIVDLIG